MRRHERQREEGRGEEGVALVIGVDLGGTRIRAGAVGADGALRSPVEERTEAQRGPAAVLEAVQQAVRAAARPSAPSVIGIACAGQIHPATGTVVVAPNLGWRDVPLGATLAKTFSVPVVVENDVRAAAWGEFRFGAGRGASSLIAVFVGTGVGSGAVLGGALWRGVSNVAGEVGHTQVVPDGRECPCGRRGCLEAYVSGSGFQRALARALAAGVRTRLETATGGEAAHLTAPMVATAAVEGDAFAGALWDDAVRYLTLGLANYVTLLNPEALILGGGVIESVPALFEAVAPGIRGATTDMARAVRIARAALGDWSGVVGAAALAADRRILGPRHAREGRSL